MALGTDTTGDYVAGVTANAGLTLTGTEAGTLVIALTSSGNTGSTSSNSGLEVGSAGLTLLKGCDDNQILKYTDAGGWACAADTTGGTVNSFATITAPSGTSPVADSTTDTLTLAASRLGYSDAANFRHAFSRWTGRNPSEFRGDEGL